MRRARTGKPRALHTRKAIPHLLFFEALRAGRSWAKSASAQPGEQTIRWVNDGYTKWLESKSFSRIERSMIGSAGSGFVEGYCKEARMPKSDWVLVPARQKMGAIISAMNEEQTLPQVLKQLERLPLDEIIVVVNGSNDRSFHHARRNVQPVVVNYGYPLGHDVGRAIGAKLAKSDILLFIDADFVIPAEQLEPFLRAVSAGGVDVALNDITPYIGLFSRRDEVTRIKQFLNVALGRPDLAANSMTAIPHALSRKAVKTIGYSSLCVPPKAHAIAINSGLRVTCPFSVDVLSNNKMRDSNSGHTNPVADLIIGDHVEALYWSMKAGGSRLAFPDRLRNRRVAKLM